MIAVGYPVRVFVGTIFPLRTFGEVAMQASAAGIVAVGAFFAVTWFLRSPELAEVLAAVNRKMFKSKNPISGAEEAQGV